MDNIQLIKMNELSNAALERGITELGQRLGEGGNIMGLLMNPKKAAGEFGDAFNHLMAGINGLRAVNAELVRRATGVEGVSDE